jgi:O-antigen/teichoic acid export membrane protein
MPPTKKGQSLKIATLISMVMRAASGVLDIVMGAVMARILSLSDLGVFFLTQQFIRLVSLVISFGLPTAYLKVIGISSHADDWQAVRRTLRQSLLLMLLATIAVGLVYAATWPFLGKALFSRELSQAAAAVLFGIVLMRALELVGSAFFRGVRLYSFGTFLMSVPRQMGVILIAAVYWFNDQKTDIETVLYFYCAVSVLLGVAIVALMIRYMRRRSGGDGSTAEPSFKAIGGLCFPLMLQAVLAELALRIDLWVLGFFGTDTDVAIYGAAQRLTMLLLFIMTSINLVIPPALATAYQQGDIKNLQWMVRATATASFLFALPFAVLFIAFPATIMSTVYGPVFEAGAMVLVLQTIGRFSGAASGNRIQLLQMTGNHGLITRNSIVFMVITFVLCLALVPRFGAEGVAAGSAIAIIGRNVVLAYYCRKHVGVSTLPTFRPADLVRLFRMRRQKLPRDPDAPPPSTPPNL